MRLIALGIAVLASAAAAVPPNSPIYVTGHNWAPFISPMGESYRARTPEDDPLADWFNRADLKHAGFLTADEMQADAMRFFATLDADHSCSIEPDELAHYEWEVAPDVQVMARTRRPPGQSAAVGQSASDGADRDWRNHRRQRDRDEESALGLGGALQGAARYGLLDMPEPVAAAGTEFDAAITRDEFRQAAIARFQLLDTAHQGRLTLAQLEALRPALPADRRRAHIDDKAADKRLGN